MHTRTLALLFVVAASPWHAGCSDGAIESTSSIPGDDPVAEPGAEPGGEPEPTPEPEPALPSLTVEEAQDVFNAAVLAALQNPSIAQDRGAKVELRGEVAVGSSIVNFAGTTLTKAPFELTGDASIAVGGELAYVVFDDATLGSVYVGDFDLGFLEALYPAISSFNDAALDLLLNSGLECGAYDLDIGFGYANVYGNCSADVGGIYVEFSCDVSVSLPANVEGYLHAYTPYVEVSASFGNHYMSVSVNGEEVFSLDDVTDIIWIIMGL